MARTIKKIIIHISDSHFGNKELIEAWHKARGFSEIGYHFVILNAYPTSKNHIYERPDFNSDGKIEFGRDVEKMGAHCRGQNHDSIGICLIGKKEVTGRQIESLITLVNSLMAKYNLTASDVYGHKEFNKNKTCPNLDMDFLRELITNAAI